ncbi:MAG: hypothetical protein ABL934_00540 [Lysobacteraceae bacterium]
MPEDTSSDMLWRAYATELSNYLVGSNAETHGLHILTTMEVIDINGNKQGNYDRIVNWCDPVPDYAPVFNRSGRTVSGNYGNYLTSLAYPKVPESKRKEIEKLRSDYLAKTAKVNAIERQVGREWEQFQKSERGKPANRRTSYDVWYAREWGLKAGAAEADVPVAASAWAHALTAAYGGYQNVADALIQYENRGNKVEGESQSGLVLDLFSCSLGSENSLAAFVRDGEANASSGKYALESVLTTDVGQRTVEKWSVSARGGFGGFFGGRAKGERTKISEDDRKFKMVFRFRNLSRVPINRDWYSPDIVAVVNQQDQFVKGAIVNPENLWGKTGVWRLTPTQLFIGYKPSLVISFSTKDFDYVYSKWSAGAGFGVGSFWIGGKGSGSKEKTTWNNQEKTLSIEYDTPEVYVVAVSSSFMPRSTPAP